MYDDLDFHTRSNFDFLVVGTVFSRDVHDLCASSSDRRNGVADGDEILSAGNKNCTKVINYPRLDLCKNLGKVIYAYRKNLRYQLLLAQNDWFSPDPFLHRPRTDFRFHWIVVSHPCPIQLDFLFFSELIFALR